jgi:hypothetical protein
LKRQIPNLEQLTKRFVEIIGCTTGKDLAEVAQMLGEETTLRYPDAIRHGLSHRAGITAFIELAKVRTYGQPYCDLPC